MNTACFRLLSGVVLLGGLAVLGGCGGGDDDDDASAERRVGSLRLVGQQVLPRRGEFQGTVVGGFSGIDYDAANGRYVLVSDDRTTTDSAQAPRMYTARLDFDVDGFTGVQMLSTFPRRCGSTRPRVVCCGPAKENARWPRPPRRSA